MPALTQRRLAGFRFEAQPPELPEVLPRMDIAVFVGFAAAGPLHRPVVVEDAAQFRDLFGDDLSLAWDEERGKEIHAYLAPAVRAFFSNGGQRCWVIRVAGEGTTSTFPIPGLARVDGNDFEPASARARAQGSGFDSIEVATALSVESLGFFQFDFDSRNAELSVPVAGPVRPGDLLRLTFSEAPWQAFFVVNSTKPSVASPVENGERITAQGRFVAWLQSLTAENLAAETSPPSETTPEATLDGRVWLPIPQAEPPAPGALHPIDWGAGKVWVSVEDTREVEDTASPSGRHVEILGRVFHQQATPPAGIPTAVSSAERITFEIRARDTLHVREWRLNGLGFAAAHARWWAALPDDATLFGPAVDRDATEQDYDRAHAGLTGEAREPRFPFAGAGFSGKETLFIPVGMNAMPSPYLAGTHEDKLPLERGGLNEFGAGLFLDARLQGAGVSALMGQADYLRYQSAAPDPRTRALTGIHAALEVEEATLIAVPDAVHRGWMQGTLTEVPASTADCALPHPTWWRCRPPDEVPKGGHPKFGEFLRCSLKEIPPPVWTEPSRRIRVGPLGKFELSWTSQTEGASYVLEESSNPEFHDAVEVHRGKVNSRSFASHVVGAFYYRLRAEVCGESSDWSDAFVLEIQSASRFVVKPVEDYQTDALLDLLDIQRSLLRLCAARGDLMAVLALPGHFREDDALAYLARVKPGRGREPLGDKSAVFPLGVGEAHALSYGAVYHPWLIGREEDLTLRRTPPDGVAAGVIARRSLERGAWIAPANEPVRGVVALDPPLGENRQLDLLLAQLNQIRQEPYGFITLNADTLADGDHADLRPINVRRLLILLRRAALKLGMNYVFEPNDASFRRLVQDAFTGLLDQMFVRGAFAGGTPATSYQVVTDESLNPPQSVEQGRFFVDLRVAPALPMSFVTVRLVQRGECAVAVELR